MTSFLILGRSASMENSFPAAELQLEEPQLEQSWLRYCGFHGGGPSAMDTRKGGGGLKTLQSLDYPSKAG